MVQLRSSQQMHPRGQEERSEASLSRGRASDAFSDGGDEERERSLQRLPASIQAMLLRAKRTLSNSELNIMATATADHRCEALRMIFEGKSADEAVSFLLNVSDGPRTARSTSEAVVTVVDPPARDPRMHTAGVDGYLNIHGSKNVALSSSNGFYSSQRKCVEHATHCAWSDSENPPSPIRVAPVPSKRETTYNGYYQRPVSPPPTVISRCRNTSDGGDETGIGFNSLSIQKPSPQTRNSWTPVQPLGDVRVNTIMNPTPTVAHKDMCNNAPVLANRIKRNAKHTLEQPPREEDFRATPAVMYASQVNCSAWDEQYKTFIVHPNQLRRLGEERQLQVPPDAIRPRSTSALKRLPTDERLPFSRQNTPSTRPLPSPPALLINSLTSFSSSTADMVNRHISSSCSGKKVSTKVVQSQQQKDFRMDVKQDSFSPIIPPVKDMKRCTKRKDSVLRRWGYSDSTGLTPRTALKREAMTARGVRSGITTPRRGIPHRSLSTTNNRTPQRRGEMINAYPSGVSMQTMTTMHHRRVGTSLTSTLAQNKGAPLPAASCFVRSHTSAAKPPSHSLSTQKLRRTSTTANYPYRYNNDNNNKGNFDGRYNQCAPPPTWSARYSEFAI